MCRFYCGLYINHLLYFFVTAGRLPQQMFYKPPSGPVAVAMDIALSVTDEYLVTVLQFTTKPQKNMMVSKSGVSWIQFLTNQMNMFLYFNLLPCF